MLISIATSLARTPPAPCHVRKYIGAVDRMRVGEGFNQMGCTFTCVKGCAIRHNPGRMQVS